jgi:hypothetical protein
MDGYALENHRVMKALKPQRPHSCPKLHSKKARGIKQINIENDSA